MVPLLNGVDALVTGDAEMAEILNIFFASVTAAKTASRESQSLEVRERVQGKEDFPLVEEDLIREHLAKITAHKSMSPIGLHPHVLRQLSYVIAELHL